MGCGGLGEFPNDMKESSQVESTASALIRLFSIGQLLISSRVPGQETFAIDGACRSEVVCLLAAFRRKVCNHKGSRTTPLFASWLFKFDDDLADEREVSLERQVHSIGWATGRVSREAADVM